MLLQRAAGLGLAAMEIYVTAAREQQLLFRQILDDAARRASSMLAPPHEAARLRAISDHGLTPIEELKHSPLAEDQLLATALRLYPGAARPRAMVGALRRHFTTPPGWLAVEISTKLRAYAHLYSDLWCDPRIAAPAPVRREMLALVSALQARCAALDADEHS